MGARTLEQIVQEQFGLMVWALCQKDALIEQLKNELDAIRKSDVAQKPAKETK